MNYNIQQKLRRKVLKVEGMTCISCQNRIEKELRKIPGVVDTAAYYRSSTVHVTYDINEVSLQKIINVLERIGYNPISKSKMHDSKANAAEGDGMGLFKLVGLGIILLALYSMLENTGIFDFIPGVNQNMGYGILFIVGLLTSIHCIAMCGGINLSQCISSKCEDDSCIKAKLKPSLLYNSGRIISYTLIGGAVGAIGSAVGFSGEGKGIVALISGILMIIIALNMLNVFPSLRKINPVLPEIIRNLGIDKVKRRGSFYVGLLNGFMPCGPLQAMQLYALGTGSFIAGASAMFVFGLGTIPLMFGFGAISTLLSARFTRKMMSVSAVLVMVLGIIMLSRGFALSGFAGPGGGTIQGNKAALQGDVQVVTMEMDSRRYTPLVVQEGIPVVWKINVEQGDLNGCNNPITIPRYGITKELELGENIIEFTPREEGRIAYSCWMGMIRSNIQVVSDLNTVQ